MISAEISRGASDFDGAHKGKQARWPEAREEVNDRIDYLDSDGLRRQANSVVQLTVATFYGLIGTVVTGVLE